MDICFLCQSDITRVYDDELAASLHRLADLHADYRMSLLGVGADQHDDVRILGDILDGIGHGAGSKGHIQTRYGCGVADTGTVIGIIGAKAGTNHLLHHVDILVGGSGAGKTGQGIRTVLLLDLHEFGSHQIQCLIPGSPLKFSGLMVFDQRVLDTLRRLGKVKASAASLDAEQSLIGGAVISLCIYYLAILHQYIILAAGRAMGTGGQYFFVDLVGTVFLSAFHGQGAGGTCLYAVTARLADTLIPGILIMSANHRLEPAVHGINGSTAHDLFTGIYTSVA